MIFIILAISYLLEVSFSNIIPAGSFLVPLFFITGLVVIYPYFKEKRNFLICSIICGLIYDISFYTSGFINTISFSFCGILVMAFYNYFRYNIYSTTFIAFINIVIFRLINYFLLLVLDFIVFNPKILFKGIYNSIIMNILYVIILYRIVNLIASIFNKKKE